MPTEPASRLSEYVSSCYQFMTCVAVNSKNIYPIIWLIIPRFEQKQPSAFSLVDLAHPPYAVQLSQTCRHNHHQQPFSIVFKERLFKSSFHLFYETWIQFWYLLLSLQGIIYENNSTSLNFWEKWFSNGSINWLWHFGKDHLHDAWKNLSNLKIGYLDFIRTTVRVWLILHGWFLIWHLCP